MAKKLTKKQIESLAKEIRSFLLEHQLWIDTTIYFNGKAFSTDDRNKHYAYNDPDDLIVLENQDPKRVCEYACGILDMTFEGPLYDILNENREYGWEYGEKIEAEFLAIFHKYGLYYELGYPWSLSACYE